MFCFKCGAYCTDCRPGVALKARCERKPASLGMQSQLMRNLKGLHPHYRATTKSVVLGSPMQLAGHERVEVERTISPDVEAEEASVFRAQGQEPPDVLSQASVLASLRILECKLPRVRTLGEKKLDEQFDNDSDRNSDGELL